jgi:RNA polymerase sigma-70 factor, ECF subfamily
MSTRSRAVSCREPSSGECLMSDPPVDSNEPPGAETRGSAQPEPEYDGGDAYRGTTLYEPLQPPRMPTSLNYSVDDNQVSALSDSISEWIAPAPRTGESPDAKIIAAPDLDAFYRANSDRMCRKLAVVFRGDVSYAEDIVQEAFVVAYRHWPRISTTHNPYGYVAKIAWRLAMKWMVSQRQLCQTCADLAVVESQADSITASDIRIDLARALDRLPEQLRIVAGLSLLGYTPKDIAGILDIPTATSRTRLKRARDRLIKLVEVSEEGPQT